MSALDLPAPSKEHPSAAFLIRTLQIIQDARLLMVASSLAYTTLLSVIPVMAVSFAIFQVFGGMQRVYGVIEPIILHNLAQGTGEEAIGAIRAFVTNTHAGAVGLSGFIGLVFTSMSLLSSIENAINLIWQTPIKRPLARRIAFYWLFITLGPLSIAVVLGALTSMSDPIAWALPDWGVSSLVAVGFFFLLNKFVPQEPVKTRPALMAALITTANWALAEGGFRYYTRHVATYGRIYGSLGAVPVVLLWIYIVWVIVLTGAAMTAALQRTL